MLRSLDYLFNAGVVQIFLLKLFLWLFLWKARNTVADPSGSWYFSLQQYVIPFILESLDASKAKDC